LHHVGGVELTPELLAQLHAGEQEQVLPEALGGQVGRSGLGVHAATPPGWIARTSSGMDLDHSINCPLRHAHHQTTQHMTIVAPWLFARVTKTSSGPQPYCTRTRWARLKAWPGSDAIANAAGPQEL